LDLLYRTGAAVATLGSGNSLGPEGSAVEIGAGISRIVSNYYNQFAPERIRQPYLEEQAVEAEEVEVDVGDCLDVDAILLAAPTAVKRDAGAVAASVAASTLLREQHHLFLAGTAAGVAGGFGAPIAGVFFAIEVGNRYLSRNTVKLDEEAPDGPRADIAAIVLAAAVSNLVVSLGLHERVAFAIQGNSYAMESPVFELSVYMGLGLISGLVSVVFNVLRDVFTELYAGETWARGA
jgi:H+/Cl- antiporter ClcA